MRPPLGKGAARVGGKSFSGKRCSNTTPALAPSTEPADRFVTIAEGVDEADAEIAMAFLARTPIDRMSRA